MFYKIKEVVRKQEDRSVKGMWNPEELKGDDVIKLMMYDAGYCQVLQSKKFNFKMVEGYTYSEGTTVTFDKGSVADVIRLMEFMGLRE